MSDLLLGLGAVGTVFLSIFVIAAAILYIFLPFAVYGTKPLLHRQNDLLVKQNKILLAILDEYRGPEETGSE